jgi:hypothetical protein
VVDEFGERGGCGVTAFPAERSERGEYRLPLVEVDVANLAAVAPMPAEGGAAELLGSLRTGQPCSIYPALRSCGRLLSLNDHISPVGEMGASRPFFAKGAGK